MLPSRTVIGLALALLAMAPALAADPPLPPPEQAVHPAASSPHHPACLSKAEQRAALAAHQAISLANAIRSLRAQGRRAEVVRARLCRDGDRLVYLLTLLGRSGRVWAVHVDAVSGELIAGR
jgi:hypothetical protein